MVGIPCVIWDGFTEETGLAGLWCFLFGALYFAYKGIWGHAVISFVVALCTFGISWVVYPFFAKGIIRKAYLQRGWVEV